MTRPISVTTLLGVSLALCAAHPAQAQYARFAFTSETGDFIGQGQTYDFTYTPANTAGGGLFSSQILSGRNVAGQPAYLRFLFDTPIGGPNRFAFLDFATDQLNLPMAVGTYADAQRAAFADPGHPGLDVSFQNRGANTLRGSFNVTDLAFATVNGSTVVDRFSVDFVQYTGNSTAALRGYLIYRRTGAVPGPEALPLFGGGFVSVGLLLRRRARR